jgi:hypothetical protein
MLTDKTGVTTCGVHAFSLPDARIDLDAEMGAEEGRSFLTTLNTYPSRGRQRAARRLELGYPNPIHRARMYELALADGGSNRDVAETFGVTREEVCHCVTLFRRLPPDVVANIEAQRDPARLRRMPLRWLLKIARMTPERAQRRVLDLAAI